MQRAREPLPSLGEPLPSNLAGQAGQGGLAVAPRSPAPNSFPPSPLSAASLSDPHVAARSGGLRSSQSDVSPRSPTPSQPRARAPLFIALLAIVLVVAAGGAYYAYTSFTTLDRSTPQASVTGYFRALKAQDYATAWRYDANSRNNPNSQAGFTQSLQADDASYGAVRSANITQVEMTTSSQAIVTASVVRGESQSPMVYTLQLTEYDGSVWLIVTVGNQ
jgi:hypothetical protein